MASANLLSNEYSDHSLLSLDSGKIKINQLNVAQLGRFQIFPNDRVAEGFNWSSTLRTPTILVQLAKAKPELTVLGYELLKLANCSATLEEKNKIIEAEANKLLTELRNLGFNVKSFKMVPLKLFNPGVSPNLLWKNPGEYIHGPTFVLEDTESFTGRMKAGFDVMFANKPDVVTAQEVEFGSSDGIDFSNVHESQMQSYPDYDFFMPPCDTASTVCVTYFKKDSFTNVSDSHTERLTGLVAKLKCFGENDLKTIAVALEHKSKAIFTVVNIHADYGKANTTEPWKILREIFDTMPNLIVAADFNLTLANKAYFYDAFKDFNGKYTIKQTPEPVDIGNPTYDLIISN